MLKLDVAAIYVAEVSETLQQCSKIRAFFFGASRMPQDTDDRDRSCLLRARRERPRRSHDQRDELAASDKVSSRPSSRKGDRRKDSTSSTAVPLGIRTPRTSSASGPHAAAQRGP